MRRVAYQGEPGAFSEEAVRQCCPGAEPIPCASFEHLFAAIPSNRADAAMAPVHNTVAGPVHASLSLLVDAGLWIAAETKVRVRMQLAGIPGATIEGIEVVRSHPVALRQCGAFFTAHPWIRPEECYDTAASVREMMESRDPRIGAIASPRALELYRAELLKADVQDVTRNYTRFLLLTSEAERTGGANKIAARTHEMYIGALQREFEQQGLVVADILPVDARVIIEATGDEADVLRARANLSGHFHLLGAYKEWHDATWT